MTNMTGAQALLASIMEQDVDTVFGIPGVQLDHFYSAMYDNKDKVRVINTRHEQGAAYMAFGYAQSSGRPGVCSVAPGPGLLNTTAALSTAYACNTPVVCVTGQIPSTTIGGGAGELHELPDQLAMIKGVTKFAARIEQPEDTSRVVNEAFSAALSGRNRPVELEMAPDIMGKAGDVELLGKAELAATPDIDLDAIKDAAKLINAAKKPIFMIGGGAFGCEESLLTLAELLQIPVVMSASGRGIVSEEHYLGHGMPAGHHFWSDTDLVIAIGTRLHPVYPKWGVDDDMQVIRIDIDDKEINRQLEPAVSILADAPEAVALLLEEVSKIASPRPSREDEMLSLKASLQSEFDKLQPQVGYLNAIRAELPPEGIFVEELTQVGYVSRFALPIVKPRTFITTGYQGTLGFGFATALGVKVANPDVPVVAVCGDGGFMFNVQELSTAAQHNIGLVTIVFNDNAFGNVKRIQKTQYDGKMIASDLHNPDFVKLAENFGVAAEKASNPEELRAALRRGFKRNGPTLIEVPMTETPRPWGFIHFPPARG